MNLKEKANNLKTDIPTIFIALKRKETPLLAKIIAAIIIGYALSPIDLIPDFIPVLGYLDDLILLPILITICIKLIPDNILNQCRQESLNLWASEKQKKWYYAIFVIMIWILCTFLIIKFIWFLS